MIRRALFVVTIVYTVLVITRPQEFVLALVDVPVLQGVLLLAFGIWLFAPNKGVDVPQFRLVLLFLASVWLSLGLGVGWWGGIVPAAEKLLPPILLFVIVSGCVRSVSELKVYSAVVIACACVLVLHGHMQKTTGIGWTGQPMVEGRITYSGIFNDANDLGLLIVTSLALTLFHIDTHRRLLVRLVFMAALGWLLYGVFLTNSRGTMLATLLVLAPEIWRKYGRVAVAVCAAVVIPVLTAYTRFSQLDAEEESAAGRFEAWYEGIQFLRTNPIFGFGWDTFPDHTYGITAHNSWVLAMAELGIFGYTFWFAFVTITGWMIYRLAFPYSRHGKANSRLIPVPTGTSLETAGVSAPPVSMPVRQAAAARVATPARVGLPAFVGGNPSRRKAGPGGGNNAAQGGAIVGPTLEQRAAFYLLLAALGFSCGAFFLSQSYKAMLFLNCGLILGRFFGAREARIDPPEQIARGMHLPLMFGLALASIVAIWLLVKILV